MDDEGFGSLLGTPDCSSKAESRETTRSFSTVSITSEAATADMVVGEGVTDTLILGQKGTSEDHGTNTVGRAVLMRHRSPLLQQRMEDACVPSPGRSPHDWL